MGVYVRAHPTIELLSKYPKNEGALIGPRLLRGPICVLNTNVRACHYFFLRNYKTITGSQVPGLTSRNVQYAPVLERGAICSCYHQFHIQNYLADSSMFQLISTYL